jgi:hypothetical protein
MHSDEFSFGTHTPNRRQHVRSLRPVRLFSSSQASGAGERYPSDECGLIVL